MFGSLAVQVGNIGFTGNHRTLGVCEVAATVVLLVLGVFQLEAEKRLISCCLDLFYLIILALVFAKSCGGR